MKRPLFFILIFLVLGIIINYFITNIFVLCLLFLCLILLSFYFYKIYKINFAKFLFVFSLIGYCLTSLNNTPYYLKEKENINAIGYVKNIEKTSTNKYKFILHTTKINNKKSNINILVYTQNLDNIKNGSKININGTIYYPSEKSNPSDFNEKLNFKINNIKYKMYANVTQVLKYNNINIYFDNLKQKLFEIYDNILPQTESNILKAMLLGEKDFLDEQITNLYRTSGIYHILAISGLHIGILALFLTKFFKKLNIKFYQIFVIFILIFYCYFTGGSLSTIRATIMCITVLIASMLYKSPDFISSICLSAIILLFKNPYYIFDIGFLYSYTSVFAIAFLGGRLCDLYKLKGIKQAFVISFFVCLAIKPITAYYFYNISILDVFLNIIIIPFMSIVVILGFLSTIIGIFSIPLAKFFIGSVYYILRFFTYICKVVDNMDFNNIIIGKPSIFVIIGLFIMLIFIAYAIYDKRKLTKNKKFINLGILIFIISIWASILSPTSKNLNVTMLDIGQGDSIVGTSKDGTFLIDGGGNNSFSTGQQIILPFLTSKGITEIDFVFATHNDSDHIKGIYEILDKIKINHLFLPIKTTVDENYENFINLAKQQNINIHFVQAGDKMQLGNISFHVLHPNLNFNSDEDNNNSIVLKMVYKNNSMLFTGDIEKEAEQFLIQNNQDLKSDILKVAHHGSKSSSTDNFVKFVNPKVALISCKENNSYNHPSPQTLDTLKNNNVTIYRTDINKAINITFYDDTYKIKTTK